MSREMYLNYFLTFKKSVAAPPVAYVQCTCNFGGPKIFGARARHAPVPPPTSVYLRRTKHTPMCKLCHRLTRGHRLGALAIGPLTLAGRVSRL